MREIFSMIFCVQKLLTKTSRFVLQMPNTKSWNGEMIQHVLAVSAGVSVTAIPKRKRLFLLTHLTQLTILTVKCTTNLVLRPVGKVQFRIKKDDGLNKTRTRKDKTIGAK